MTDPIDLASRPHAEDGLYRTRRVSIICGAVHRYDAISECALASMEAFADIEGKRIEVRLYCLESNATDSRIHIVANSAALAAEQFYQSSDVIIHHFGIFSPIHDVLTVAPRRAHVMVQFYGVTPPQYLPRAAESVIANSFIQAGLFVNADELIVNSDHLADELGRVGLRKPMRKIELFGVNTQLMPIAEKQEKSSKILEVVFCGRLVYSKQVLPLVSALEDCVPEFPSLRLKLIGVSQYSDGAYLRSLQEQAAAGDLDVEFELDRSPEEVASLISTADLLVLPSLHEGFGVPVAEALTLGIPVVCSNAGSLPEVAGGFGLLFEAGDVEALTAVLRIALAARKEGHVRDERGYWPQAEWVADVKRFAAKYRRDSFVARWKTIAADILGRQGRDQSCSVADTDALRSIFPANDLHEPAEALLVGHFVMRKAMARAADDLQGAINVLHRWAFGRDADEDAGYWSNVIGDGNLDHMLRLLSTSEEVRGSSLRTRSLAGMGAAMLENLYKTREAAKIDPRLQLPPLERPEIEQILYASRTPAEFVRSAYLMILGREHDVGGYEHYCEVATDRTQWPRIVNIFYISEEYLSLPKTSNAKR